MINKVFPYLKQFLQLNCSVDDCEFSSVSGGSINDCRKLECAEKQYFIKLNSALKFPLMFEKEKQGLDELRNTKSIGVPKCIGVGMEKNISFIVLSWIEKNAKNHNFWEIFGAELASLHRNSSDYFGLPYHNYIGSLTQVNTQEINWCDFFAGHRLLPLTEKAVRSGLLTLNTEKEVIRLCNHLQDYFPKEPPALLHGDLWNGNFMTGADGKAWIFDPAVYFGHREMDIAMTRLFGGFDTKFYSGYNNLFPLEKGSEKRISLCNLYPLLVHINLFGGGYLNAFKLALQNWI